MNGPLTGWLAAVALMSCCAWLWRRGWRVYLVNEEQLYREPFHSSSAGKPAKTDDEPHCLRGL
jgi:hypothetical protein